MSNEEKSQQLGVEYSLASIRLLRSVAFRLIQDSGKDVCIRCGLKIESVDQFSLDHIKPWLHVDPQLFWDLTNVGFSHRRCNSGARRSRKSKYTEEGIKKRNRDSFREWYAVPANREVWNAKRRERYQLKMASPSIGLDP